MSRRNSKKLLMILFRLLVKHPLLIIGVFLSIGAVYLYEVFLARPAMQYMGEPKAKTLNINTFTRVFRNDGFMLGYSDIRGNPLWVIYEIEEVSKDAKKLKRPSRFSSDWRNVTQISHDDYTRSGYDRGHMAPNYAISRLYGRDAQLDTFLMSNITPQRPKLNQRLWQRLEEVEIKYFTKEFEKVWVVTGPLFDDKVERLKNSMLVEIPDAFYKIFVGLNDGEAPKMLAVIMPQKVYGNEPLTRFVTTVDEVEKRSGYDFFPELDDTLEEELESKKSIKEWNLKSVASIKSRY